jgi:hypothetical protein
MKAQKLLNNQGKAEQKSNDVGVIIPDFKQ